MVMFMGHFSSPRMGDTLVPYLKFLFLKTLFEWMIHSFIMSTFSLMEFLDSLHLYC